MTGTVNHDQHFKNLIVDYPREALALFRRIVSGQASDAS